MDFSLNLSPESEPSPNVKRVFKRLRQEQDCRAELEIPQRSIVCSAQYDATGRLIVGGSPLQGELASNAGVPGGVIEGICHGTLFIADSPSRVEVAEPVRRRKKLVGGNWFWITTETIDGEIFVFLHGFPKPIEVLRFPAEDDPFLQITGQTILTGSGSVPDRQLGVPYKAADQRLGTIISNSLYDLTINTNASVFSINNTTGGNTVSSTGRINLTSTTLQGQGIGFSSEAAVTASQTPANDSDTNTQRLFGSHNFEILGGVNRSPGFPVGSGGFSYTYGVNISTNIIETPMTYGARLFRDGDTLHVVIGYGMNVSTDKNVVASGTVDDAFGNQIDFAYDAAYGPDIYEGVLNQIVQLESLALSTWKTLHHSRFSISRGKILSKTNYNFPDDTLPSPPSPAIALACWQPEYYNNHEFNGPGGVGTINDLYLSQNICVAPTELRARNSAWDDWTLDSYKQQSVTQVHFGNDLAYLQNPSGLSFFNQKEFDEETIVLFLRNIVREATEGYDSSVGEFRCFISGIRILSGNPAIATVQLSEEQRVALARARNQELFVDFPTDNSPESIEERSRLMDWLIVPPSL